MTAWLLLAFGILLLILLWITASTTTEGFLTVDPDTVTAQRQQLQFEGERRYNTFARAQSPLNNLGAADVQAAFQMVSPTGTSMSDSLSTLFSTSGGLGAADNGSGKQGRSVEQTGMVQSKINFCESLSVNCSLLDDPRAAECGMCHRDGLNSKGKAHRGGMYISSDDQVRANEAAVASGPNGRAKYQPTIGTCAPQNFTLVNESCQSREMQLQCQSAGGPSSSNNCAQCYGASPAGATGLLYVGPKPRSFAANLYVTHPGGHSNAGSGMTITYSNGYTVNLPSTQSPLLALNIIPLTVSEGDTLTITIYGVPLIWAAWLSSPDGNRTVSVDVGEQSIQPTDALMIIGDKRSPQIAQAVAALDVYNAWPTFEPTIPNSVMFYGRRPDVIAPRITSAKYGPTQDTALDVTTAVQAQAGAGASINVTAGTLQVQSPVPGQSNYLWINMDKGSSIITPDGGTVSAASINNKVTYTFQVPATLVDPVFADDKLDCPSGPLVFTEVGAGLMGSHSCFTATGGFNPTVYCLQELFAAAGGTQVGSGWPRDASGAAALVQNDSKGVPSLDATVAYLNTQAQIALYGMDMNNNGVDFATLKAASQFIFGRSPANPCDTAEASTGPHSVECLSYLWGQSGCLVAGSLAPMDGAGNINQGNVTNWNNFGSVTAIQGLMNATNAFSQDSSDFDQQYKAAQECQGVDITQKVVAGSNPPEVFQVQAPSGIYQIAQADAAASCSIFGAQVATLAQLTAANQAGAEWCSTGWVSDSSDPKYPITSLAGVVGCGAGTPAVETYNPGVGNANCYGVKPVAGTQNVIPFNSQQWSMNILPGQAYAATAPPSSVPVPVSS